MRRGFYLITYDVPDDKRRTKAARALEALGERVQYSVFEAWLTPRELAELKKKLRRLLNEEEDSLRIYALCADCQRQIETWGRGQPTPPPQVMIL